MAWYLVKLRDKFTPNILHRIKLKPFGNQIKE